MIRFLRIFGLTVFLLATLITMMGLVYLGNRMFDSERGKIYNCSVAEISPDFTTAMREECRRLKRIHT